MSSTAHDWEPLYSKVPKVTVLFWIAKLLTTAMGEATSDYAVHHMNPYLTVTMGGIGLALALGLQFIVPRYVTWVYWLAVVMVAVFGTMVADVVHIVMGVPYAISVVTFAIVLTAVFVTWYKVEGTLSIHSIFTRRRELFYWAAVLATFAMGTATGDMTARTLHLGYLASGVLFAALFLTPAVGRFVFGMNRIFAFWFAYVITRPLGASFADWFGMPPSFGGLGYGRGHVSLVLTAFIIVVVGFLVVTRLDTPKPKLQRVSPPLRG